MIYRAESTALEMNDALDQVMSALGRQIRKNKTKLAKKVHSAPSTSISSISRRKSRQQRKWKPNRSTALCAPSISL